MADLTPYPYRPSSPPARHEESAVFRVGDLERSTACDALAEHYAAGRLDPAELEDRLARAMAARSQGELWSLFADLGPRRAVPTAVHDHAPVAEPRRSDALRPVVASILVLALLLAGGMLMVLGAVDAALALAALVGGTATGVAGACVVVLARGTGRRR